MEIGPVLIIDDDSSFRGWTSQLLSRNGYSCRECDSLVTAKDLLNAEHFPLIVSDVNLPGNEGLALIRDLAQIREDATFILVTGSPSVDSAVQSFGLPISAYLIKPFETECFLAHVRSSLIRSKILGSMSSSRERFRDWQEQLTSLEELLKIKPDAYSMKVPVDVYITLTMQNILEPLMDLRNLAEMLTQESPKLKESACNLFKCPRLDSNEAMLTHTVDVLERTKQSFKSKELGELRKKLEKFVEVAK